MLVGFGEFPAQVGERVRFAICRRAQRCVDRGPQVRGLQPGVGQLVIELGKDGEQVCDVLDDRCHGGVAARAGLRVRERVEVCGYRL